MLCLSEFFFFFFNIDVIFDSYSNTKGILMVWNLFQVSTTVIFPFFWGEKTQLFFYLFFFDRFINRDGIDFSDAQGMQAIQVVPPLFLSRHLLFSSNFKLYETFVFIVSRSGIWLKICKECWNTRQGNLFFLRFLLIYIILHCHCLETSFHFILRGESKAKCGKFN